jgi:hypothetical protein
VVLPQRALLRRGRIKFVCDASVMRTRCKRQCVDADLARFERAICEKFAARDQEAVLERNGEAGHVVIALIRTTRSRLLRSTPTA